MEEARTEVKTQLVDVMDRKVASLEAQMEVQYNEVCEETTSTLYETKDQVAAVYQSQEKMLSGIDGMGKELQDPAQGDANTDGKENVEIVLVSGNFVEERLVLEA